MVQQVKDPASLQWLRLLLWHGFEPWPRNFCMSWAGPKKKKKKKKNEQIELDKDNLESEGKIKVKSNLDK